MELLLTLSSTRTGLLTIENAFACAQAHCVFDELYSSCGVYAAIQARSHHKVRARNWLSVQGTLPFVLRTSFPMHWRERIRKLSDLLARSDRVDSCMTFSLRSATAACSSSSLIPMPSSSMRLHPAAAACSSFALIPSPSCSIFSALLSWLCTRYLGLLVGKHPTPVLGTPIRLGHHSLSKGHRTSGPSLDRREQLDRRRLSRGERQHVSRL